MEKTNTNSMVITKVTMEDLENRKKGLEKMILTEEYFREIARIERWEKYIIQGGKGYIYLDQDDIYFPTKLGDMVFQYKRK